MACRLAGAIIWTNDGILLIGPMGTNFSEILIEIYTFSFKKIDFVNKAKYLGLLVKGDLSWDDHILQLCKTMNYYVHVLRRLNKIFPQTITAKIL